MLQNLTGDKLGLVRVINDFVPPNNEPIYVPMLTQICESFNVYLIELCDE